MDHWRNSWWAIVNRGGSIVGALGVEELPFIFDMKASRTRDGEDGVEIIWRISYQHYEANSSLMLFYVYFCLFFTFK